MPKLKPPPCSLSEIRRMFDYDSEKGVLIHAQSRQGVHKGSEVGRGKPGRRSVMIFGKEYFTSRIIYFWNTGEWPPMVDHKDGNVRNELWDNLRAAVNHQNGSNCKARNKTTGLKGVYRSAAKTPRWFAQIGSTYLGSFGSPEEAAKAYNQAAIERYGEFARLNQ